MTCMHTIATWEILMAQNLYTFGPFSGLTQGIPLAVDIRDPYRPERIFPPHLRCGDGFIAVERSWKHPPMRQGRLMSATVAKRHPEGRRSFEVFDKFDEADTRFYLYFDNSVPAHVKVRHDPNQINAWVGARTSRPSNTFALLMGDGNSGNCFIAASPGDTVYVYSANGAVHSFGCRDNGFHVMPLSLREMAQLRVTQFNDQIENFDLHVESDMRRLHGIVGGCVRLLALGITSVEVREVFVDFLCYWASKMTARQRVEIRTLLLAVNDPLAGNFVEGWSAPEVVRLDDHRRTSAGKTKAELEQRKAERAAKDKAEREAMRGKSGGKSELRSNPEKAKKRARTLGARR